MQSPKIPSRANLVSQFTAAAKAVSAFVKPINSPEQALTYAVELCACQKTRFLRTEIGNGKESLDKNSLAAPGLNSGLLTRLKELGSRAGINILTHNLRNCLEQMEAGLTFVDHAIAETGTLVINASDEDLRLATMICEAHVAVVPISNLVPSATDLEPVLRNSMNRPPAYWNFITGASRTADIERVLALGVHGPLELHILLWEDS